jgi:hypothetical protein
MPTILNNACLNRVPKILKLKLTSNDLTQMKVIPYNLLPTKVGDKYNQILGAYLCVPADHGYEGTIRISNIAGLGLYFISFRDSNSNLNIDLGTVEGTGDFYQLSCSEGFNIGIVRPDIEFHLYYFSESVSVNFDVQRTIYIET